MFETKSIGVDSLIIGEIKGKSNFIGIRYYNLDFSEPTDKSYIEGNFNILEGLVSGEGEVFINTNDRRIPILPLLNTLKSVSLFSNFKSILIKSKFRNSFPTGKCDFDILSYNTEKGRYPINKFKGYTIGGIFYRVGELEFTNNMKFLGFF